MRLIYKYLVWNHHRTCQMTNNEILQITDCVTSHAAERLSFPIPLNSHILFIYLLNILKTIFTVWIVNKIVNFSTRVHGCLFNYIRYFFRILPTETVNRWYFCSKSSGSLSRLSRYFHVSRGWSSFLYR